MHRRIQNLAVVLSVLVSTIVLSATPSSAETVNLTVHNYPAGDGPSSLASNGVPFRPGVLSDEGNLRLMDGAAEVPIAVQVLARWHGDNSIRVVLLQFEATFGGDTKTYTLEIGASRSTPDRALTTVVWNFPEKIITVPENYLCASMVTWEQQPLGTTDFPDWEQKQLDRYGSIEYDGASLTSCANSDQYYNSIHTSYQLYVRTGDIEYLTNARKWALHHARDQIYLSGDRIGHGVCSSWGKTRYTYIQGLVDDYFFWGHEESRDVAGLVADYFYMTHADKYYYIGPGERVGHWTEREPAFALLGLVAYYEATNDPTYLNRAQERMDALYQMQADNGGTAWVHNLYDHDSSECYDTGSWGVSPWMTGVLLEGVIKYHKLTGDSNARQSILWALDYLKDNCFATGAYAGQSMLYLCGCANPVDPDGRPDLDNMMSHAFAYGHKITGSIEYRDVALTLFNNCVDNGWAGASKHYNQQFRSSGHTVAYLTDSVPTLLQSFSTAYTTSGIEITWRLSETGVDMQFFIRRSDSPNNNFVELDDPEIVTNGLTYTFIDPDIEPGLSYRYIVEVLDEDGHRTLFETGLISAPGLAVKLREVFPNPFNPQTTIVYTTSKIGPVTLGIYDARGRRIRLLVDEPRGAGEHTETWYGLNQNGETVASGVYFVRLETNGVVRTTKAVLSK